MSTELAGGALVYRRVRFCLPILVCLLPALYGAAPSTPPFRIGLNAPFVGNSSVATSTQLANLAELGVAGLRHVEPGDVGWTSVQRANGLFNFGNADTVIGAGGFGYLPTFYGAGDGNLYVPPGVSSSQAWSSATYGTQTTTYLQTVVYDYKTSVRYWEIANEMDGKTTSPAGFSAAGYADFLNYSRSAIVAADPSARVVLGGTVGNYAYPLETARQWLRGVLDAGGATGFDVFNYHDYKSWWTLPAHYDQYRALLDEYGLQATPIWVSETAQASVFSAANINPTYCSADGQAADIWRRPCLLFAKGAQTVFWHSYWDNSADTSGFRNMGLASADTGIRKKSWHSFRLLCQKIEGFASATLLAQGDGTDDNTSGGNGAWVVRFDFADGTRRWVAWSPNGSSLSLDGFSGVASLALTTVVPATLSTDGLTPGWSTSTATVHQGRLELGLADAPVLLEVATGYQAWAATHFSASELADSSVGAAEADPDGDGLSNLSEYALGGDPRVADSTALVPTCSLSTGADGHDHLTLTARLVAAATDLECSALVTGDLQTWQSGDGVVETLSDTVNGGVRTLVLRDREPVDNAGARRFMRLSVTAH